MQFRQSYKPLLRLIFCHFSFIPTKHPQLSNFPKTRSDPVSVFKTLIVLCDLAVIESFGRSQCLYTCICVTIASFLRFIILPGLASLTGAPWCSTESSLPATVRVWRYYCGKSHRPAWQNSRWSASKVKTKNSYQSPKSFQWILLELK